MRRRPAAIFIAGLGHSGSTLLELLLAANDRVVGLGQVHQYLRRDRLERRRLPRPPCTCGRELEACVLWGPIRERCEDPGRSLDEKYRLVLEQFWQVHGDDMTLVDSSKNPSALRHLLTVTRDVAVIHLVRDVRSWTISWIDRARRWGGFKLADLVRESGARGLSRRLKLTPWYRFRIWRRGNVLVASELDQLGLRVVRLGYEALAAAPASTLRELCDRLGLDFDERMLAPAASKGHLVLGNSMRFVPEKTRAIMYSTKWLTRREWVLPSLLLPRTMKANSQWVYGDFQAPVDQYEE